ncbi:carbonic anhydrase 7-like [Argonauta hians]
MSLLSTQCLSLSLLTAAVVALLLLSLFVSQSSGADEWHYKGNWSESYATCANGTQQSPIDIISKDTVYDEKLRRFVIWYNPSHTASRMVIYNNGKTVKITTEGDFFVANGGLRNPYKTDHVHLHWGKNNNNGTEHYIDTKSFAMELHMVNYDIKKYNTVQAAAPNPDGLAVLGVIYEISEEDNPALNIIMDNLEEIQKDGHPKVELAAQSLRAMLPQDLSRYYRYNGSLTTPACYESVIWTVFDERLKISTGQMKKLRELFFTGNSTGNSTGNGTSGGSSESLEDKLRENRLEMVNNFRPVQPLNNRVILRSFEKFRTATAASKSDASRNLKDRTAVLAVVWLSQVVLLLCGRGGGGGGGGFMVMG